jgi:hypothetical protein
MGAASPISHQSSTCYMNIKSDPHANVVKTGLGIRPLLFYRTAVQSERPASGDAAVHIVYGRRAPGYICRLN